MIQVDVIRYIGLSYRQLLFNHGMSSFLDFKRFGGGNLGSAVAIGTGHLRKRKQGVQHSEHLCILLDRDHIGRHLRYKLLKIFLLQGDHSLLSMKDFLLVLFQLWGNVALGIHQSLLANPAVRHLILVDMGHLQVVAKDLVVGDLQGRNAC